jgi:hypothetical protein
MVGGYLGMEADGVEIVMGAKEQFAFSILFIGFCNFVSL